jgi:C4-dicarboxylate-specific signal transduction histidine kinase
MSYATVETSAVTAAAFAARYHPAPSADLVREAPRWAWNVPEEAPRNDEPRYHEHQTELAHANRVAILGQLSASIAHEVNQPLAAIVTNAEVALRMLTAEPANPEAIRQALTRIVRDGKRAGDIVGRTRALMKKAPPRREGRASNEVILEAVGLTHGEAVMNGVSLQTQLADDLPPIAGDRVQLQQVMLNLIINAVEAMSASGAAVRELVIRTTRTKSGGVLVAVRDSGPGVDPADLEQIFDAFYSTKPDGLGMGLSICRAIIEAHGGILWATPCLPLGTTFQFTLPASLANAA